MSDSLVSADWELIDPTPDALALFAQYNETFFWGKLHSVVVSWSPRMTSCAGICCYEGRGGLCSIKLSTPLLKLRPRKDLVETLLHEMIHAYLFVTQNNRDRDGHGPEFQKHMHRINTQAKTNITIYHTFYDEVSHYKTHVWRCDGPCRQRKPYHGFLKRASNRAPGPNDIWWRDHQSSCGGTYHKVSEPQEFTQKQEKKKAKEEAKKLKEEKRKKSLITNYLAKTSSSEAVKKDDVSKNSSSKPRFTGVNVLGGGTASASGCNSQSTLVRRIKGFGDIPLRQQPSVSCPSSGFDQPVPTVGGTSLDSQSKQLTPTVGGTSLGSQSKQLTPTVVGTSLGSQSKQLTPTVGGTSLGSQSKQLAPTVGGTSLDSQSKQLTPTVGGTSLGSQSKQLTPTVGGTSLGSQSKQLTPTVGGTSLGSQSKQLTPTVGGTSLGSQSKQLTPTVGGTSLGSQSKQLTPTVGGTSLGSQSKQLTSTVESHKRTPKAGLFPVNKTPRPAGLTSQKVKEDSRSIAKKRPLSATNNVGAHANTSQRSRKNVLVLSDSDDDIPLLYRPITQTSTERADNSYADVSSRTPCPVCGVMLLADILPHHVDECLKDSEAVIEMSVDGTAVNDLSTVVCPICSQRVPQRTINRHLDSMCSSFVSVGSAEGVVIELP